MSTAEQRGQSREGGEEERERRGGSARFALMFVVFFVGLPASPSPSPSPSICGRQTTTLPPSSPSCTYLATLALSLRGEGMGGGQCQSTSLANIRKASHTT